MSCRLYLLTFAFRFTWKMGQHTYISQIQSLHFTLRNSNPLHSTPAVRPIFPSTHTQRKKTLVGCRSINISIHQQTAARLPCKVGERKNIQNCFNARASLARLLYSAVLLLLLFCPCQYVCFAPARAPCTAFEARLWRFACVLEHSTLWRARIHVWRMSRLRMCSRVMRLTSASVLLTGHWQLSAPLTYWLAAWLAAWLARRMRCAFARLFLYTQTRLFTVRMHTVCAHSIFPKLNNMLVSRQPSARTRVRAFYSSIWRAPCVVRSIHMFEMMSGMDM